LLPCSLAYPQIFTEITYHVTSLARTRLVEINPGS